MAKKVASFSAKDRVEHTAFGPGTITESNERYTTIQFDDGTTRKFMTQMVALKPTKVPPPEKPVRKKAVRKKKTTKKKAKSKATDEEE